MAERKTHYGVNADGSLSVCKAKPENVGRYNCHHSEHRDMTPSQVESYYDGQSQLRRAMARSIAREAKAAAKSFNARDVIFSPAGVGGMGGIIVPVKSGSGFTLDLQDANGNRLEDVPKFKTRGEAKAFVAGMSDSDKMFQEFDDDDRKAVMDMYAKGLSHYKNLDGENTEGPHFSPDTVLDMSYTNDSGNDFVVLISGTELKGPGSGDEDVWSTGRDAAARHEATDKEMEKHHGNLREIAASRHIDPSKEGTGLSAYAVQFTYGSNARQDKESLKTLRSLKDKDSFDNHGYFDDQLVFSGDKTQEASRYFRSMDEAKAYVDGALRFQAIAPEKSTLDYNFQQVGMVDPTDKSAKFSYNGRSHTIDDLQSLDGARVRFSYRNAKGEEHETDSMVFYDPENTRPGQILTVSMDRKGGVYKDEEGKPRYHWYKFSGMTTPIELLEKRDSHDTGRNSLRK